MDIIRTCAVSTEWPEVPCVIASIGLRVTLFLRFRTPSPVLSCPLTRAHGYSQPVFPGGVPVVRAVPPVDINLREAVPMIQNNESTTTSLQYDLW